jgi:hypothetical protein
VSSKEITIIPGADGKISVGNQIIELTDESRKTYETDNMEGFELFLLDKQADAEIYYSATHLYLVPRVASKQSHALAICTLSNSAALSALVAAANKELTIMSLEKLLTSLRKFAQGSVLSVLSNLRNFSVAKKQTYERDVDNQGNFRLLVQREGIANSTWNPPEKLSFAVPCFKYINDLATLEFDFIFSLSDGGAPVFLLQNLTMDEELMDRRREIIESRLGVKATCPKYWGASKLHPQDDGWKYRENKASL